MLLWHALALKLFWLTQDEQFVLAGAYVRLPNTSPGKRLCLSILAKRVQGQREIRALCGANVALANSILSCVYQRDVARDELRLKGVSEDVLEIFLDELDELFSSVERIPRL